MDSFQELFSQCSWDEIGRIIHSKQSNDVLRVIDSRNPCNISDFMSLLSPAAEAHLPRLEELSSAITKRRFGNTIQMYAPLYLSNKCTNICTYCGFSLNNKIERITLTPAQIILEINAIKRLGFDHVLLVTGESRDVGMEYFKEALRIIKPHFSNIAIEVQPLSEENYRELSTLGLHSVLVYQETYNEKTYRDYHPKGKKSNFQFRLNTPDRLGRAGIHKIGLGALLGLEDWRIDAYFVALHLSYLRKKYWKTRFSVSFPRLRPAEGLFKPSFSLSENNLRQVISAFRIFDENLELSLSTRESANFRDQALKIGITSMSAGSRTDPGGYAADKQALKQFEIDDSRTPAEVASAIRSQGYEAIWKDWDRSFLG